MSGELKKINSYRFYGVPNVRILRSSGWPGTNAEFSGPVGYNQQTNYPRFHGVLRDGIHFQVSVYLAPGASWSNFSECYAPMANW